MGRLSSPAGHKSAGVRTAYDRHADACLFAAVVGYHAAAKDAGLAVDGAVSANAGAIRILFRLPAPARVHLVRQGFQSARDCCRYHQTAIYLSWDVGLFDFGSIGDYLDKQDGQTPWR